MSTGYIRDTISQEDWIYGALRPVTSVIPLRFNLESLIGPAADQGSTFECVCYSIAGLKRYHEWKQSGAWLTFDPHDLYSLCKQVDGHPAAQGTAPRVAMDILHEQGMIGSDGNRYKISAFARQKSVPEICAALFNDGPVVLGIQIDVQAFSSLSDAELDPQALRHAAGHCMLAVGYDNVLEAFRIRNSWGTAWGDNGHFWLKYEYLTATDPNFDAWSTIDATEAA